MNEDRVMDFFFGPTIPPRSGAPASEAAANRNKIASLSSGEGRRLACSFPSASIMSSGPSSVLRAPDRRPSSSSSVVEVAGDPVSNSRANSASTEPEVVNEVVNLSEDAEESPEDEVAEPQPSPKKTARKRKSPGSNAANKKKNKKK